MGIGIHLSSLNQLSKMRSHHVLSKTIKLLGLYVKLHYIVLLVGADRYSLHYISMRLSSCCSFH
ncbi:hypothetical protein HNR69_001473 [Histophilus somni]|nr:hypothetical protein [Histophilus somni]